MLNEDHYRAAPARVRFAIVTVSDTRTAETDRGGERLAELVEAAGHLAARRTLIQDDLYVVRAEVAAALADPGIDVVLLTGGTGVSPRDVTVDAVRPLFEKELSGFGELFRSLSFAELGPAAMLSRATAGVAGATALFLLPGSPAALELAMRRLILPEIGHLLGQLRRTS